MGVVSSKVPKPVRTIKHFFFQFLPGYVGARNRACFHHLTRTSAHGEFKAALSSVEEGDICIDCGANVGEISRKLAERGAQVYSFEPDPWSFAQLEKNTTGFDNIIATNKAVGAEPGFIDFYRDADFAANPDKASLASSMFRRPETEQETVTVEVVDFIKFIGDLGTNVKMVKMDIEGAEVPILEKLLESDILHRIEYLFVETHELQFSELVLPTEKIRRKVAEVAGVHINLDWH